METASFIGWILMIVTLALLAFMTLTKRWDIMSFHVLLLVGMIQFYFLSMALVPVLGEDAFLSTYRPVGEGWITLAAAMPIFLVVYLVSRHAFRNVEFFDRFMPHCTMPITSLGFVLVIMASMAVTLFTFVIPVADFGSLFLVMIRPALATFALGLAVAYWLKNRANPLAIAAIIVLLGIALLASMVHTTDRRYPLSALLIVPWMLYWCWLRYRSVAQNMLVLGAAGFVSLAFLLAYTNIRHEYAPADAGLQQRADQLQTLFAERNAVFVRENLIRIFAQDTAANTMFIMENYPSYYPHLPFNGLVSVVVNPIPRVLWPGKPEGIGTQLQRHLNLPANLGPGIIGHGWVEGAWFGVIGYALAFGLLNAALDGMLRRRAYNPYFIAAMGCPVGHVLGIARGETYLFVTMAIYSTASCMLVVFVMNLLFRRFAAESTPLHFGPDEHTPPELDDTQPEDIPDEESAIPDAADGYADEDFRRARAALQP